MPFIFFPIGIGSWLQAWALLLNIPNFSLSTCKMHVWASNLASLLLSIFHCKTGIKIVTYLIGLLCDSMRYKLKQGLTVLPIISSVKN